MNPSTLRLALEQFIEYISQEAGEATTEDDVWDMDVDFYCIDEHTLLADDGMRDPLIWTEAAGGWHSPGEVRREDFKRCAT